MRPASLLSTESHVSTESHALNGGRIFNAIRIYGFAATWVVIAVMARLSLDPLIGFQFPFATLYFAVLLSAWYGGVGPAFAALALGVLAEIHFLLPPRGGWTITGLDQMIGLGQFIAVGTGIALIGGAMIAARRSVERSLSAEKAINNRATQLKEFIDQAPVSIAMFDREMRYITASRRWQENYGLIGTPIESRSHYEIFPDLPQRWKDIHQRCLAGSVVRSDEDLFERADGSRTWLRWEVRPWYVSPETIGGLFIFSENITAQKEAEQGRHATEARYSKVIEASLESIWITTGGRIVFANRHAASLFDVASAKDLVGLVCMDFMHPDDRPKLFDRVAVALERGEGTPLEEARFLSPCGRVVQLEIQAVPLEYDGKQSVLSVARDVSERKRLEAELMQSQKMESIGQLTGGVAHDFNNLLTVITGTIDLVVDAVEDDPAIVGLAKMIKEAAWRGADLTQRLLAFSRRQPLQPVVTDVNRLIVDTTKLLKATLGEQIEIKTMLRHDLQKALVDPAQLTSSIINLALNSRDAMPEQGKLVIETDDVLLDEHYAHANSEVSPGPYVMIAISDTGTGIPAAILHKVFDPFFTTKEVGRGTGLGLSMVYGFVKQSNGHVKIYSEDGHGTTVKLYLPKAQGDEANEASSQHRHETSNQGGTESILVVEDDALVREYVVAQLKSLGYRVASAENASQALSRLEEDATIDVLFTDIIMPGPMNGRHLANEAVKRKPSLKVVFTSGYTENAIVHQGRLDAGVVLLSKPYRKSDLARIIRQAVA
jgi:PAS domain S-box-containing protein